jgi:hypothetical protein
MTNFVNLQQELLWVHQYQDWLEIFLQYHRNLIIKHVIKNNHIIFYTWYFEWHFNILWSDQNHMWHTPALFILIFSLKAHTKQMLLLIFGPSYSPEYTETWYRHLQKSHLHRYHNSLQLQPPSGTNPSSLQIPETEDACIAPYCWK